MNADRLIARLAAVMALTNFGAAPWPTLAGNLVFDSRIEPVEDFAKDKVFPVCVVYTDYDKDHWDHSTSAVKPRFLTVTFELLAAAITDAEDGESYTVAYPTTDSEIETTLDLFEIQIVKALQADNPAANCWRHLMPVYENVISRRGATVEGGQKLAARQVTVEARTPRGPKLGVIAPIVGAFLDRLEQHASFQDRVPAIRAIYTGEASLSDAEKLLRMMGWTTEAGRLLGYERGPAVVLPPVIYTTGPGGAPLP